MSTPGFYAIIPANVRYCKDLEPSAKLLYGEITALAVAEGYCWATNEYFAELYGVDISTIRRWLASLKQKKFISVQITREGFSSHRKIWITPEIQKMFASAQNRAGGRSKSSGQPLKNERYINTESNTEEEERRADAPSNPPKPAFEFKRVKMDSEKYEGLLKDFGKNTIDEMVDRLDEYADINPKRFKQYACHAAVIRKWIRDDKDKFSKKAAPLISKNNKEMAEKIAQRFEYHVDKNEIQVQETGLLFCYGQHSEFHKYDDFGFRDKVFSRLRKMNLPVEGL